MHLEFISVGEYMLRRDFFLILVGAVLMLLGGALFLNFFRDEAIWAEWIVGPITAFVGVSVAIVGVALHCYAGDSAGGAPENAATSAR